MNFRHDLIIVGAGLAGLRAAVECADEDVGVVSKVLPTRSHSGAAQGGITASIGNEEEDRWEWHMFDTVKGSDYLADQDAVEVMVRDAPRAVYELEHMGVPFNRTRDGKIAQRTFGGHTRDYGEKPVKRACYAADRTGRVVLDTLYDQCLRRGVKFYPEHYVLSLVFEDGRCGGVVSFDLSSGELDLLEAKAVLLATGGCGKIYETTSNGYASTGDGLDLAYQSCIPLEDMEFVQFHPTGLYPLGILVSEAARGEGGVLVNGLGERFMERYAPTVKDLAPRDIISRAILTEIKEGRGVDGKDFVHLDLTRLGEAKITERLWEITSFARIYLGIDPVHTPIPVLPTCHYIMGGIPTDMDGRVLIDEKGMAAKGLYAAGECACVSVHGANRLGCNSRSMRSLMMEYCSIFRNENGLKKGLEEIGSLKERYNDINLQDKGRSFNYELMEAIELEHQLSICEAVLLSALHRKESRGAHIREDYPERDDRQYLKHTLIFRNQKPEIRYKPVKITRFQPEERIY
ncbi:MAG: FAD-dependent oxidoreductase [Candidatus Methanoperedens sp.]|nr:FAD-dependent oxidoreductase [Candidatus Methanoperedens sp.]